VNPRQDRRANVTIAANLAAEVTFTRPERANMTIAAGAGANVAFACRQPGRKGTRRQPFAPAGAAPPLAAQTALPEVRHRLPRRGFNTVDAIAVGRSDEFLSSLPSCL
jgi:hypothetical protein